MTTRRRRTDSPGPLSLERIMQDTKRCPKCGSGNMLPIRYGYPPPEMVEESYVGRVVLGGCILFPRPPLRQLRARKARPRSLAIG